MSDFANQDIYSWKEFYDFVLRLDRDWIYRGQPKDCGVPTTTLERALSGWHIGLEMPPASSSKRSGNFDAGYGNRSITVFTPMHCFVWR
jgi:hypothetical protein